MPDKESQDLSVEAFVNQQIKKWQKLYTRDGKKKQAQIPVITVCMEPGSNGCLIAQQLAERLGFDFFHRDMVHRISESSRISTTIIDSLEKERLSGVQDFISSIIQDQYIHPSIYLDHLMKVVGTIGKHGHAVIVGRGANFIIPPRDRFAVRVIAPLEVRIENIAKRFNVSDDVVRRRVVVRENRRRAFVRQSFNAEINNPIHYDLVVNSGSMTNDAAVEAIIGAVMGRMGEKV